MLNIDNKEDRLVRYLLGELSAEERENIEKQYFQNDTVFQDLLHIESDLIYDYLNGDLSSEQRVKFESQILSTPQGRRKVESSRGLLNSMPEKAAEVVQVEKAPWWQSLAFPRWMQTGAWQSAAVMLLLVIGAGWLGVEDIRLRSQLGTLKTSVQQNEQEVRRLQEQVASAQQQRQQEETAWQSSIVKLNEELQSARADREKAEQVARQRENQLQQSLRQSPSGREPTTAIATYIFPFNSIRGASEQTEPLTLSKEHKAVRFRIDLGRTAFRAFHVSLQTVDGSEVWQTIRQSRRTTTGNSITVNLPATVFTQQHYILVLTPSGANNQTESFAEYSFRIVRKD